MAGKTGGASSGRRPGVRRLALALAVLLAGTAAVAGCSSGDGRSGAPAGVVDPSAGAEPSGTPAGAATPAGTPASPSADAVQQRRFAAAAKLLRGKPGYLGIAVRDRRTGATWRAGNTGHPTWTASTIKLALVTGLLERARTGEIALDAGARRQIADILDFSSDDAATALWNRYGKDNQASRFQQRYGMTGLTFVAGFPRFWGHMKCTTEDLLRLMSYILDRLDPADRDYLLTAMRHVGRIQQWGVWSAGAGLRPGTKNGWSIEPDPGGKHWVTNAVGFAGPDQRYAVAVMYQLPPGPGIGTGVHAVSDLIATAFGAPTPALVTVPDPSTGL
jgi:hypothetical protein